MASAKLKRLVKQRQRQARQQYHIHNYLRANYAESIRVDFVAVLERQYQSMGDVA